MPVMRKESKMTGDLTRKEDGMANKAKAGKAKNNAKTARYAIRLDRAGSITKFVNVMNRIPGCAMLIGREHNVNAKSLLGTMNLSNEMKGSPVTLEITLRDKPDAKLALSGISGFEELIARCGVDTGAD